MIFSHVLYQLSYPATGYEEQACAGRIAPVADWSSASLSSAVEY